MGFATFIGSTGGRQETNSSAWVVTWSNTMLAGDGIFLAHANDGTQSAIIVEATGNGYSTIAQQPAGSTAAWGGVFFKVSTGGETGATFKLSGSGERGTWHLRQYRDFQGTPTATSTNGNSSSIDPPSHTAGGANDYTWIAFGMYDDSTVALTAPSGYGNLVAFADVGISGAGSASADKQIAATQTEDPPVFGYTGAAEQWSGITVALQGPATAAATGMFAPSQLMWGYGV